MRWLSRSVLALILVSVVYVVSPYVALYRLARAVEARDAAALDERVNLRAVRASVAKDLLTAYLVATGRGDELKGLRGQVVAGAGVSLADRMLAGYATPGDLLRLLNTRSPGAETAADADDPSALTRTLPLSTSGGDPLATLRTAWRLVAETETVGFRIVSFALPVGAPRDDQFRLTFRVNNALTWRLVGLGLPPAVRQRLVQDFIRSNQSALR